MEIQLQELIDQIKKNGVEVAETEAEAILNAARKEAERIVAEANAEAERIRAAVGAESERTLRVSEEAIRQAGRNVLISFRESVTRELQAILRDGVAGAYSSDAFAALIVKVVEAWSKSCDAESLTVILPEGELASLESTVLGALKERMLGGVTLRAGHQLDSGFRIAAGDTGAYYDYSAEAVVDMLSAYLSPRVTALLKEAEGA